MKITLLLPDTSDETFVRTKALYNLLINNYDVEVIAVSQKKNTSKLFKDTFENYKKIDYDLGKIVNDLKKNITGDLIYAIKTKPTSFGFAMSLKNSKKIPVIVDISAKEIYNTFPYSNKTIKNILLSIPFFNNTNSFIYTWILEKRIKIADEITVSSNTLQKTYGGTFISTSCDEEVFNSDLYKRDEIRKTMGWEDYVVILFAGKVNRDTDINLLINAVKELNKPKLKLAIVGDNNLKNLDSQDKFYLNSFQPPENIAKLLSACDLVVIPQNQSPSAFGKLPVKLYEAMAAAKIIIAPEQDDFPDILSDCGFLYQAGDLQSLKEVITMASHALSPENFLGKKARQRYLDKFSKKFMVQKLKIFFDKFEKKV